MAVYTRIDEALARALLAEVAPGDALRALVPLAHGSINTTYRLDRLDGPPLYLRINENKSRVQVEREVALVQRLGRATLGATTPTVRAGARGPILELAVDGGRLAIVFDALPGEDLPPAAVTAAHTEQVGAFLARAHRALRRAPGAIPNPYAAPVVAGWLQGLRGHAALAPVLDRLERTHGAVLARRRPLPRAVIHGDLFIDNTKWRRLGDAARDELAAVFDWEMAGRDARMRDLAIALLAWCFRGAALDVEGARAMVAGYQRVSALTKSERAGLFDEAVLAAIRFTVSRIRDFEVRRAGERAFLDYREFLARLDALETTGARAFRHTLGLA